MAAVREADAALGGMHKNAAKSRACAMAVLKCACV
jgi:hypothetical protein